MKNIGYIVLLLLALPFTGIAQNDSAIVDNKETPNFNNQIDLDVQFLGIEGIYKTRLSNKVFFGFSIGAGVLFKIGGSSIFGGYGDFFKLKLLVAYNLNDKFHVYNGIFYSPLATVGYDEFGQSIGMELGFFYKIWKIEFGIEPSFFVFKDNSVNRYQLKGLASSLLIIKIPLKRW